MAFNAGGSNVGGVLQTEGGVLKVYSTDVTPGGTGDTTITHTCPAGKKWILKSVSQISVSLVSTISNSYIMVNDGTIPVQIYKTASALSLSALGNHNINIAAGQSVQGIINQSAYTSGDIRSRLLVQELDI